MRALIQRVKEASVLVNDEVVGCIQKGMLVFLGVAETDTGEEIEWLVNKLINLRIFEDEEGKMNTSLLDNCYEVLIVSQFTLYGDTKKGTRPSFINAAQPEKAERLYEEFIAAMRNAGVQVQTGKFQAMMDVKLTNWGPVTLMIER